MTRHSPRDKSDQESLNLIKLGRFRLWQQIAILRAVEIDTFSRTGYQPEASARDLNPSLTLRVNMTFSCVRN